MPAFVRWGSWANDLSKILGHKMSPIGSPQRHRLLRILWHGDVPDVDPRLHVIGRDVSSLKPLGGFLRIVEIQIDTRATPLGFTNGRTFVSQGCAVFAALTLLRPGLAWGRPFGTGTAIGIQSRVPKAQPWDFDPLETIWSQGGIPNERAGSCHPANPMNRR